MASVRARRLVIGGVAVVAFAATSWLGWRMVWPSQPTWPEPAEYTAFEVALNGRWVVIRNTGPDTLAPVWVQFEADVGNSATLGYGGVERFEVWGSGQVIRIGIPGAHPTVRAVRFAAEAWSPTAKRRYWFRFGGPLGQPPADLAGEDEGLDPDLAAARAGTDRR